MKKILLLICVIFLIATNSEAETFTVDSLVSTDDLTIEWLNGFKNIVIDALNSFPGGNIEATSVTTAALDNNANPEYRWGESFNEFVFTGLLPPTSVDLDSTTTAGTAYVKEDATLKMKRVVKDATINTYTASKDTYVDLSSNGTYTYSEVATDAAEPAVAANSIRLALVVTDGDNITSVTDKRVLSVQIATQEDFVLNGFNVVTNDPNVVTFDPGIYYVGATRINKVAQIVLNVGTAGNYINGASERATSTWIYMYGDDSGNIKFDDDAPDYHDTDGNTAGIKYYFKNGSDYWRFLVPIRLNATGSGNITPFWQQDNKIMWDTPAVITTSVSAGAWSGATSCSVAMPPMAKIGIFGLMVNETGASDAGIFIKPNGSFWTSGFVATSNGIYIGVSTQSNVATAGQRLCAVDSSQQIQYGNNAADDTTSIGVEGYIFQR